MEIMNLRWDEMLFRVVISLGVILLGIILGKLISIGIKKLFKKTEAEKKVRPSFLRLITSVIEWSVYITFFSWAIKTLEFPGLSELVSPTLLVIPSFVASIFILSIGFAIAIFLRGIIEDSEVTGWKSLSLYLYYFINLVFGLYSLRIALIIFDPLVSRAISILLVVIVGISIAYIYVKKEIKESYHR
jgi:hypothetical protein